ncbi:MAG: hypothetical protein LBU36_07895 [Clostridiales bacterium]|jgi:hypothetical protein|nr:hypothetical protein [Clostridiales bacterium]
MSNIYEIARIMSNRAALLSDMEEAAGMVCGFFHDKYLSRLRGVIDEHNRKIMERPPKEVGLISAFKAFTPPERHAALDKMIDAFLLAGTLSSIKGEYGERVKIESEKDASARKDNSVHNDGVYDMDDDCLKQRKQAAGGAQADKMVNLLILSELMSGKNKGNNEQGAY